ncbi:MAG: MetQ/NlpA family ABC transporter substrate-binding protein [Evtepia sp.]
MKKLLALASAVMLTAVCLVGCGDKAPAASGGKDDIRTTTIGASTTPHAEILKQCIPLMEKEGYKLEIKEFQDYVMPNEALDAGDLNSNYFQHQPYLDTFNKEHSTDLVSVAKIHYEPFGIYAGKTAQIADLKEEASIAVPNDGSNETRALLLLQQEGLITLKDGIDAKSNATILDIKDNPKKLKITEMEAAQLTASLPDVDLAVINGNYAMQGKLNVATDALATESVDGDAAQTYANILAVKAGNEEDPAVMALVKCLTSDTIRDYIETTYKGAVVPVF